jgi:hypothetical protein
LGFQGSVGRLTSRPVGDARILARLPPVVAATLALNLNLNLNLNLSAR